MLVFAMWWATPAFACSYMGMEPHVVDPESADVVAPSAPVTGAISIKRGAGPQPAGCGSVSMTSCDDVGWIELVIAATDDASAPEAIGYRLEVVEGDLPDGLTLPTEAVLAHQGQLTFHWTDESTDDQEPFDVTLSIVAVDGGGNESDPVELDIADPGSTEAGGGCNGTGGRLGAGVAGLALLAMRRSKR